MGITWEGWAHWVTICLSLEMYFHGLEFPIESLFLVVVLLSVDSDPVHEFPSPVESQIGFVLKHYCHFISSFMALPSRTQHLEGFTTISKS